VEEGTESGEEGQAGPRRPPALARVQGGLLGDLSVTADPGAPNSAHRGVRSIGDHLELAGAVLVALWLSRSFWLPGRFVVGFDTLAYSGPNMEVTTEAWRAGRLPLWNEYIFGGVTHLGNPQAGALYPPKAIGLVLDTNRAMGVLVAAHLTLLAVGMVLLVRRLGCRPPAGLAAAVTVCAGGAVMTRTLQFEQILVLAWGPWLLLGITIVLAAAERPWWAMAGTGVVTTMVLLAGHPQIVYQLVVIALGWVVACMWRTRPWRRLGDLAVAVGAGVAVATPQLVAAAAATRDSAIGIGRTLTELESPALSARPDHVVRILFGSVRRIDQAYFAGTFEAIGHVGVAAALTAVIGIVGALRRDALRPHAVALAALAVLGVVWALGPRTPLFTFAYNWLPGFDLARASARWVDITALAVGIAVAFAVEAVRRRDRLTLEALAGGGAFVVIMVLGASDIVSLPDGGTVVAWIVVAAATSAVLAVVATRRPEWAMAAVLLLVGAELLGSLSRSPVDASVESRPFTDRATGASAALDGRTGLTLARTNDAFGDTAYLVSGFRPNTNVLAGVPSIDGYDGGVQMTDRFVALGERLAPDVDEELPLRNKLPASWTPADAASLGVRWALLDNQRDAAVELPGWEPTSMVDERFSVWENPAWIGDAVLRADGEDVALGFDADSPTRLEVALGEAAAGTGGRVIVYRQAAPGWRVRVDGEPADVVEVDGFFLAVDVPAGVREVVFEYRPRWLRTSLAIGLTGILGLIAMAALGWVRGLDRHPEE
jgi:hypothetical protein